MVVDFSGEKMVARIKLSLVVRKVSEKLEFYMRCTNSQDWEQNKGIFIKKLRFCFTESLKDVLQERS